METLDDLTVLQRRGPWPGQRVIDVGCGLGALSTALHDLGCDVLGVEPVAARIAAARQRPGPRFHHGGAVPLPCADGHADAVLFNRSLHHVPPDQMDAALAEARRVLSTGGRLWVLEPDPDGQLSWVMEPFHDERRVRKHAQDAIDRARPLFDREEAFSYLRPYAFPSLDAFRTRMAAATGAESAAVYSDEVARRYNTGDGGRFTNVIRVRILS